MFLSRIHQVVASMLSTPLPPYVINVIASPCCCLLDTINERRCHFPPIVVFSTSIWTIRVCLFPLRSCLICCVYDWLFELQRSHTLAALFMVAFSIASPLSLLNSMIVFILPFQSQQCFG